MSMEGGDGMAEEIRGIVVTVSANDLLGLLASAKGYHGLVQRMIDEAAVNKGGHGRGLIYGGGREGAVRKVNSTFDVNSFRDLNRSLELDVERIKTAIAFFNSSTSISIGDESMTVGNALKEIDFINGKLNRLSHDILNNIAYDYVEGDDTSGLERVDELFDEYKALLTRRTLLKHSAYSINTRKSVDVFLSTPALVDIVNDIPE